LKLLTGKYNWYRNNNICVTGFIIEGDRRVTGSELAGKFLNINSADNFRDQLAALNGQFSVILERENETWAACDRLRCNPLFYRYDDIKMISDDPYLLLKKDDTIDELMADAFLATGYVTGAKTLVSNIYQVEAGSLVIIGNGVIVHHYHSLNYAQLKAINLPEAEKKLSMLLENIFSARLDALKERFIAVSLSGGYDSRLVALMAAKYHPGNLVFFTYGRPGNNESAKAVRVGSCLGIKCINIEFNDKLFGGFINDPVFRLYYPYTSALVSMFFMSDYFAIKYIKDKNLIPDDTVFIPGHSADFLAGSHLWKFLHRPLPDNEIARSIYSQYYTDLNLERKRELAICKLIAQNLPKGSEHSWLSYENWIMKERQAKFIVNSAKVYSFFGYDYDLPFWDNSLVDFFSALPFEIRLNKMLYDKVLDDVFFRDFGLSFADDRGLSNIKKEYQAFKDKIKHQLPYCLVSLMVERKSTVCYETITQLLRDDMGQNKVRRPKQANYYNSYISQWYLDKTRTLLSDGWLND